MKRPRIRLRMFVGVVLVTCVVSIDLFSEQPQRSELSGQGAAVIMGRVVDADGDRPLERAVVTLRSAAGAQVDAVRTDNDGNFIFRHLDGGSWSLTATKSGYGTGLLALARPIQVSTTSGQSASNVIIQLKKYGVIAGVVLDESREPIVGATVRIFVRSGSWSSLYQTITDDEGAYRETLPAGEYVVGVPSTLKTIPAVALDTASPLTAPYRRDGASVAQLDAFVALLDESARAPRLDGQKRLVYPSQFYPGTPSIDAASVISVAPGQHVEGIDFGIVPQPAVSLSGTLVADDVRDVASVTVFLDPGDALSYSSDRHAAVTATTASGQFTFPFVAKGEYTLRVERAIDPPNATSAPTIVDTGSQNATILAIPTQVSRPLPAERTLWGSMAVSVGDSDVEGIVLPLREAHRVRGRIQFGGTPSSARGDQLAQASVLVYSMSPEATRSASGVADAGGAFATRNLRPGRYVLQIRPPAPWTVQSIALDGRDITDTAFDIGDRDVSDVVVTLTDGAGSLSGLVRSDDGTPEPIATVIVFSTNRRDWPASLKTLHRVQTTRTLRNGTYRLAGLPVGEYWVAAVRGDFINEWRYLDTLDALSAKAVRVQISEAAMTPLNLRALVTLPKHVQRSPSTAFEPQLSGETCGDVGGNGTGAPQAARDTHGGAPIASGSITGVVLSDAGVPLKDAAITLRDANGKMMATIMSDAAGGFEFHALPAGRYRLGASKAAYLTTEFGAKRPDRPGLSIPITPGDHGTVRIVLQRGAAMSGVVTDERGFPLRGVAVHILTKRVQNGATVFVPVVAKTANRAIGSETAAATDEEGRYRFYGLLPGTYSVAVTSGSGAAAAAAHEMTPVDLAWLRYIRNAGSGVAPAADDRESPPLMAYSTTFYPSGGDAAASEPVTLANGSARTDINVRMPLVPVATLSGTIVLPDGSKPLVSSILIFPQRSYVPDDGWISLAPEPIAKSTGGIAAINRIPDARFSIQSLTAGTYTVLARGNSAAAPSSTLWSLATITVKDRDIPDLVLSLKPGISVRGRVDLAHAAPDASTIRVQLVGLPSDFPSVTPPTVAVDSKGSFIIPNVTPGSYQFVVTGMNRPWTPRSALLNGRNLLDTPLVIDGSELPDDIVVDFTNQPSELSGTFSDSAGLAATDYYVILFPADAQLWSLKSQRLQAMRPSTDGHFSFTAVPPGEYLLAAVTDVEPNEWYEPTFLDGLRASSIAVSIAEGERKTQNLRIR